MDKFSTKGNWYLPEAPDNKLYGVLNYDMSGGTSLELHGHFSDFKYFKYVFETPKIIIGETDSGDITLYKCYQTSRGKGETYTAMFIFKGFHFLNPQDISFESVKVEYANLYQWLNLQHYKWEVFDHKNHNYVIKFSFPDEINLIKTKDFNSSFLFGFNSNDDFETLVIKQKVWYSLTANLQNASFNSYMDNILYFQKLLTLLSIDSSIPINSSVKN